MGGGRNGGGGMGARGVDFWCGAGEGLGFLAGPRGGRMVYHTHMVSESVSLKNVNVERMSEKD